MGFYKVLANSILFLTLFGSIFGQQHGSHEGSFEDPTVGGASGNPGAKLRFSTKALDAIYDHALLKITETLKATKIPDAHIPVDGGMLSIKSSRITDAKIPNYSRDMAPPNQIHSHLYGGIIKSEGEWHYKPHGGSRSVNSGVFRSHVVNAELNATSKFDRTNDGRPMVTVASCEARLGQFRVEIEGYGNESKPHVVDKCDNFLCKKTVEFFERAVCNAARNYVSEYVNKKLATFPTKVNLGKDFVLDYRMMPCDPVAENDIHADLEGEVLSRSGGSANFHAAQLSPMPMGKPISFSLGDYAFNTLFHQAHQQQFPFSAYDLLANNSIFWKSLSLNCSSPSESSPELRELKPSPSTAKSTPSSTKSTPKSTSKSTKSSTTRKTTTRRSSTTKLSTTRRSTSTKSSTTRSTSSKPSSTSMSSSSSQSSTSTRRTMPTRRVYVGSGSGNRPSRYEVLSNENKAECLGQIFGNSSDGQQFQSSGLGNLVFKSQRPIQVNVNDQSKKSYFSTQGGILEIYEAGDHSDKPRAAKVIYRANVKSLQGLFYPKMNGSNISGSVEVQKLELSQQSNQLRHRSISNDQLSKLTEFAKPILSAMFNSFLEQFAQFPVPLIEGYECSQPGFRWSNRTMQIDCDIRVLANAIRKGGKDPKNPKKPEDVVTIGK